MLNDNEYMILELLSKSSPVVFEDMFKEFEGNFEYFELAGLIGKMQEKYLVTEIPGKKIEIMKAGAKMLLEEKERRAELIRVIAG